jgi:2-amino-4-hydroxy-6-hydroxymethyldihydropteridine diphosphokinase
MPELHVGAGSNARPVGALRSGIAALEQRFGRLRCSSVYSSRALGAPGSADYLNMVVSFATELAVGELEHLLRSIEAGAGRERRTPTVCALDLDLLLYGERVDAEQRLPRPGAFTLPFVLAPLAELAPELAHPVSGVRAAAAWRRVAHGSLVRVGSLAALADE